MQDFEIQAEGSLLIDHFTIPVFKFSNGKFGIPQNILYEFLTGKKAKGGIRNRLNNSNLRKYLPAGMLESQDIQIGRYETTMKVFLGEDWLALCKAVVLAGISNSLGQTWQAAVKRAQLSLFLFAEHGIGSCLDSIVKENPVMTTAQFDARLKLLLTVPLVP